MIKCAHKTISLAISEKLNTIQRLQVCKPEEINMLITELDADDPLLTPFKLKGLTVL
jgi:DeoR/GlpR family transcriptional regulator of sugar metabolism